MTRSTERFLVRARAAIEGRTQYEDVQCPRCGATTRYVTSGSCVACVRARTARRYHEIKALAEESIAAAKAARGET